MAAGSGGRQHGSVAKESKKKKIHNDNFFFQLHLDYQAGMFTAADAQNRSCGVSRVGKGREKDLVWCVPLSRARS